MKQLTIPQNVTSKGRQSNQKHWRLCSSYFCKLTYSQACRTKLFNSCQNRRPIFSPTHISDPILSLHLWLSRELSVMLLLKHHCPGLLSRSSNSICMWGHFVWDSLLLLCKGEGRWCERAVAVLPPAGRLASEPPWRGEEVSGKTHQPFALFTSPSYLKQNGWGVRKRTFCVFCPNLHTKQDIPLRDDVFFFLSTRVAQGLKNKKSEQNRLRLAFIYKTSEHEAGGIIWPFTPSLRECLIECSQSVISLSSDSSAWQRGLQINCCHWVIALG